MKPSFVFIFTFSALAFLLSGCASFKPVGAGGTPLKLRANEERSIQMGLLTGKVTLPSGDYAPDFTSDKGTYYLAPTSVTLRSLGIDNAYRGGLFIPFPTEKDQRQAIWVQGNQPSPVVVGIFSSVSSGGILLYRLEVPIEF